MLLLGDGLSEDNQKYSEPVVKNDVSLDGKSLKDHGVYIPGSKAVGYNMLFDLNEVERKELLINLISAKWVGKKKRFVNIHEVIFDPRILIFCLG